MIATQLLGNERLLIKHSSRPFNNMGKCNSILCLELDMTALNLILSKRQVAVTGVINSYQANWFKPLLTFPRQYVSGGYTVVDNEQTAYIRHRLWIIQIRTGFIIRCSAVRLRYSFCSFLKTVYLRTKQISDTKFTRENKSNP
jgi:hypothetical protein